MQLKLKKIEFYSKKLKAQVNRDWAFPFLMKVGRFVRTAAMQSMPRRKRISRKGRPPHSHLGRYKKSIRYYVNKMERTVIIGPMAAKVGEALEHGGVSVDEEGNPITIEPRPHMRPALEKGVRDLKRKERDPIPKIWY